MSKDFIPHEMKRRKKKAETVEIDGLGTETWEAFKRPKFAFNLSVRDSDGGWMVLECSPSEFNPLSLAAGIAFGEISVGARARAEIINDTGIILPENNAQLIVN